MIDHAVPFDHHEEGRGRVLDEMLIKTEIGGAADDGEHGAMVSWWIDKTAIDFHKRINPGFPR
jgi:hypothetical protein